jgi:hypothetical protein
MVGKIAYWLVIIGALNWGLVGLGSFLGGNWNVVNMLLGSWPTAESIVYILVGASAISTLFGCKSKMSRNEM